MIEDGCTPANFLPGFNLECYPNRDSTTYIDSLQLDTVHTILRGTLRYKVTVSIRSIPSASEIDCISARVFVKMLWD